MQPHENCLKVVLVGEQSSGKTTLFRRLVLQVSQLEGITIHSSEKVESISSNSPIFGSKILIGSHASSSPILQAGTSYRSTMIETQNRKVRVTDLCGHRSYRKALSSELKKSDLAVLVIPANRCMYSSQAQDSYLEEHLQDIKSSNLKLVIVISKVDSLGISFTRSHYSAIVSRIETLLSTAGFSCDVPFVPISTIEGDNIISNSKKLNWYDGKALWDSLLSVIKC